MLGLGFLGDSCRWYFGSQVALRIASKFGWWIISRFWVLLVGWLAADCQKMINFLPSFLLSFVVMAFGSSVFS